MNRTNYKLLIGVLLIALHTNLHALDSDRQKPLRIVADTALIDEKDGVAVYTGSVVLTQGTLKIVADKLTIKTIDGKVEKVMAIGQPALFSQIPEPNQSEVIAKAKNIDYIVRDQTLLLRKRASIVQQENIFRGEEILYEIQSQRLQAQGETEKTKTTEERRRVEMILPAATQNEESDADE